MAENDDIESFWEGIRPPKVAEPTTADLNEAIKHSISTEAFALDYAQLEQQIWNGLGLQRPQPTEAALSHELQHTWRSIPTERLEEVRQRSLERFAESLGVQVRSPDRSESTDVTRHFEAIRTAFSALGVACRTAQFTDSYGRRTLELTFEPTQSQDPTLISYQVNSRGDLVINIDLNETTMRP